MVRHKTRWLLVHFSFEADLVGPVTISNKETPTFQAKEIYKELVKTMSVCYGLSSHAMIPDIMVRHVDDDSRLVMIRVPRATVAKVRTAITYMTTFKNHPVVASVVAVNGSARTAKIAATRAIKKSPQPRSIKELKQLDARLQAIMEIH